MPGKRSLEFCITDLAGAKVAAEKGADRIELCVDLAVGGLTPSAGLIEACADIIETHVLIRPRPGDFYYSEEEIDIMQADFMQASLAGAKGVVFGCLNEKQELDVPKNEALLSFAETLKLHTTFHRAFDQVVNPLEAFAVLLDWEVDRMLTSGQGSTALEGLDVLKQLVAKNKANQNSIEIMAGAGVHPGNAQELLNIGVDALHCSIHKKASQSPDMGQRLTYDLEKVKGMLAFFSRPGGSE